MYRTNLNDFRWSRLNQHICMWFCQVRSRHELLSLSDKTLQDIGLSRGETKFEASKLYWLQ